MLPPGVHTCVLSLCRGRFRMKEREEMWQKIEELARLNPQVCSSRTWDKMEKNVLDGGGGGLGLLPHLMRAGCSTWCQSCAHSCSVGLSLSGCVSPVWTSAALTSRLCWSGCVYSWTLGRGYVCSVLWLIWVPQAEMDERKCCFPDCAYAVTF